VKAELRENSYSSFDFALDSEDMSALDRLDEGFRVSWNPTTIP
jgi:hypothetical protein